MIKSNHERIPGWHAVAAAVVWLIVEFQCIVALAVEFVVAVSLFTTGGWANGWPFGIGYRTALSVGSTLYVTFMFWTAASAISAVLGFVCALLQVGWRRQGVLFARWFVIALALALCVEFVVFIYVYLNVDPDIGDLNA
jgi:hypothetical protein